MTSFSHGIKYVNSFPIKKYFQIPLQMAVLKGLFLIQMKAIRESVSDKMNSTPPPPFPPPPNV